ncbi:MAG: proline dehydrogenase family protein [Melioribacteraceae bacterium]|nr:proline dehydrogenase family protein [Melioribacteraceae bacterium]MCF8354390.1 proline dehydrogenase family protein [Melioribacteraceae bacterium]MCF8393013.1 proline dehydrogenase family protein [Melioribacteraceae bacterium]MCF8417244.1 proline dehydrogenase family protein [Melioribacteraceae bacterium]
MNAVNNIIVSFVKLLPRSIVHIFAKKYVAGETLEEAVNVVKDLNAKGIVATMDVLGESITTKEEAEKSKIEGLRVLNAINEHSLDANLSIKPTSLGLAIDKNFCYDQVLELVKKAKEYNNFVRIDMEDSPYTDLTIELYKRIRESYDNVGIVVQSYLRRTYDDVTELNKMNANYRLCKGIYIEPEKIAYKDKQEVRDSYMKSLSKMLDDGNYVGIATHDKYLIDESYKLIEEKNIPKNKYEFQMLYGVTEHLRDQINSDGHKIRIYVPYGEQWYAYSMRRLQENPDIAWYITKSIFTGK